MSKSIPWTCPYCGRACTIVEENSSIEVHRFNNNNQLGDLALITCVTVCPNEACKEFVIEAKLCKYVVTFDHGQRHYSYEKPILSWSLKPQANTKPFPDYIPEPIRQDYTEACFIQTLSPKASATLSRRCLQGMIRDFWGISKSRLKDEIDELKTRVDSTTWNAIDSLRQLGNIGAHMEKDINIVTDVDPDEASALIRLIEYLLKEWYIARFERQQTCSQIIGAAAAK